MRFPRVMLSLVAAFVVLASCGSSDTEPEAAQVAVPTEVPAAATAVPAEPTPADSVAAADPPATSPPQASGGVDLDLFFDGALVGETATEPCTLSGGAETMCYRMTVAGDPVTYDTGPFCPSSITDSAEAGGLWFDGNGVYDVDGAFIAGLAELYNDDNWQMFDADGNVLVTESAEEFDLAARPNVDPSLQNHCVEGQLAWLPDGEPIPSTLLIPVEPVLADSAQRTRGNLGVTLDGVVIAAAAPVDAILGAYTIAAFDDCGGHYNPNDGYHLHGAVGCSELDFVADGETPMFAYAVDGFPVHSPLADPDAVELDECNGHETEAGYHYHANNAAENNVIACLIGQTVAGSDDGRAARPERPAPPSDDAQETSAPSASAGLASAAGTLADSAFYGDYEIASAEFGTNVTVALSADTRVMTSNALPPWEAGDFPEGNNTAMAAQDNTYTFPLAPTYVGNASFERSTGVTVSGIKFDAGTAQRAQCENGVQYGIEAVNDLIPFGLDEHNAHVQNDGTYHYHDVPVSELDGTEPQHIGFANDGFMVYYSPSGEYSSSYQLRTEDRDGVNCTYSEPDFAEITFDSTPDGTFQQDWAFVEGSGDLDSCNGIWIDGEYAYFITDEYPMVPRCLNGDVAGAEGGGGGGGGPRGGGEEAGRPDGPPADAERNRPGRPDFAQAADTLGTTEQALRDALGGPPPDFEQAAATLGISIEELQAALGG